MLAVDLGIKRLVIIRVSYCFMTKWNAPTRCNHHASYSNRSCFCCSVWSRNTQVQQNCEPKHIMIVIKCSKTMQAVTLNCENAEGWLLRLNDSVLCLDYAQAVASVGLWALAIFSHIASSLYPPISLLTVLHLSFTASWSSASKSATGTSAFL